MRGRKKMTERRGQSGRTGRQTRWRAGGQGGSDRCSQSGRRRAARGHGARGRGAERGTEQQGRWGTWRNGQRAVGDERHGEPGHNGRHVLAVPGIRAAAEGAGAGVGYNSGGTGEAGREDEAEGREVCHNDHDRSKKRWVMSPQGLTNGEAPRVKPPCGKGRGIGVQGQR